MLVYNPNTRQMEEQGGPGPAWGGAPAAGAPQAPAPVPGAEPMSGTPEPTSAGLYGIYNAPNPYNKRADSLSAAAQDSGGRGMNLAAPALAFMANRKSKQAEAFDVKKSDQAAAYLKRMEASEQTKADKSMMAQKESDFMKNGAPAVAQAYREAFLKGGPDAASAAGAKTLNDYGNTNGTTGLPFMRSMSMFKDGSAVFQGYEYDDKAKKLGDTPMNFKLDVTGQAYKAKGKDWVPVENFLNADDAARMKNAEASQQRADNAPGGASGAKNKEQLYGKMNQWGKFQPIGSFRSQAEAQASGATHLKTSEYNQDGVQSTNYNELFDPNNQARPKLNFDAQGRPIRNDGPAPAQGSASASAAQQPPPPSAQRTMRMINPQGKTVMIEGNIQDAIAAGYKLVQ